MAASVACLALAKLSTGPSRASPTPPERPDASGPDLLIGVNTILDNLIFDTDPARVDPFEQAIVDLGSHLGFVTQRPERNIKRGPDDLWAFDSQNYAVIECKNAAVTEFIRKKDLDQLSGALSWFRDEYELPASALPVMIHPSHTPDRSATALVGCRVIAKTTLPKLRGRGQENSSSTEQHPARQKTKIKIKIKIKGQGQKRGGTLNPAPGSPKRPRGSRFPRTPS